MLTREHEVYCRKTEQKISRVSSLAALDEASGRGFKCFHCGRSISQEQIRQLLMATPEGLRLSRPNVWLAMLLGGILVEKGVDPARVLWRQEPIHHIVEVFADVEGGLLMFQVLEDGVSADQAFRFLARTRFFRPDIGFLVTPTAVREEARAVLRSMRPGWRSLTTSKNWDRIEGSAKASRTVVHLLLDSSQLRPPFLGPPDGRAFWDRLG